jgi:hypothetical protein
MAEGMTNEDIAFHEQRNTGTSPTKNKFFDDNGYIPFESIIDPKRLERPVPEERGQINYWGNKLDQYNYIPLEEQVEGSLSVYNHPQYKSIHSEIRIKLEKLIGCQLYNTYYYDRFYFPGQELKVHVDRPSCEISVSVNVGSNLKDLWPIWIKTPYGENHQIYLRPGDGIIYKGCERPHWRDPMPGKRRFFQKKDLYHHQVFFHYVLSNGLRSHHAFD